MKRDLSEAYVWFARAQKLGDPRATEMISMAHDKLKPKESEAGGRANRPVAAFGQSNVRCGHG